MKKTTTLLFFLVIIAHFSTQAQSFVNPANKWWVDNCCVSFGTGQTSCHAYEYYFGDSVWIDNVAYRELITNNQFGSFQPGKYYREEEGKVFMKMNELDPENLIYDFNLEAGDTLELNFSGFLISLEVLSVDSVTLVSGEKRKRLLLNSVLDPIIWIEGVGSLLGTMNTQYILSLDCWNSLNCYQFNGSSQYPSAECPFSSVLDANAMSNRVSVYPNPAQDQVFIQTKGNWTITTIEMTNIWGQIQRVFEPAASGEVPLDGLQSGVYLLKIKFQNGESGVTKVVKI
jgi:hypothetical protein